MRGRSGSAGAGSSTWRAGCATLNVAAQHAHRARVCPPPRLTLDGDGLAAAGRAAIASKTRRRRSGASASRTPATAARSTWGGVVEASQWRTHATVPAAGMIPLREPPPGGSLDVRAGRQRAARTVSGARPVPAPRLSLSVSLQPEPAADLLPHPFLLFQQLLYHILDISLALPGQALLPCLCGGVRTRYPLRLTPLLMQCLLPRPLVIPDNGSL